VSRQWLAKSLQLPVPFTHIKSSASVTHEIKQLNSINKLLNVVVLAVVIQSITVYSITFSKIDKANENELNK